MIFNRKTGLFLQAPFCTKRTVPFDTWVVTWMQMEFDIEGGIWYAVSVAVMVISVK